MQKNMSLRQQPPEDDSRATFRKVEYDLSNSKKHSPSGTANSPAASHKIPHILWNPTDHHRVLFLSWTIYMVHTTPSTMASVC
jgi:hypothetical protein